MHRPQNGDPGIWHRQPSPKVGGFVHHQRCEVLVSCPGLVTVWASRAGRWGRYICQCSWIWDHCMGSTSREHRASPQPLAMGWTPQSIRPGIRADIWKTRDWNPLPDSWF